MESLAELLKSISNGPLLKDREELRKQLVSDTAVREWRLLYPEVTEEDIGLNLNKFHQYVTERNHCSQCPGLERCPNDFEGHYTVLSAETTQNRCYVYDRKVSCDKYTAKQNQDSIRSRIRSFYVDERSLNEGYSADEILSKDWERAGAVDKVMDYILTTKEGGLGRHGLYLAGPFGTGKTFLMCYMLYELAKVGLTGAIVYMPDFSEDLKSMFQDPQKLKETIDLLKETDLLVFDDIGAENMNPWLRDHVLGTILNYRMNRKPTFFTSNYELDDLEKHFSFTSKDGEEEFKGKRIMDRIRHFVEVIEVTGYNKRNKDN
ncbi:primosomal protein DnaI [Paenibacillus sp. J2TS4]|uniref:primosomal protein DnaI n=1 Tax=Paenibacillus sp. J2TS4 TaxID=2807194 RepID=UPI001B2D5D80|nr:primosomal protein DnaI [Paenibacillus sp. J2TS4]GIP31188.1 primosomal protein DnaI [Paenibacillus sp. J2TS4]